MLNAQRYYGYALETFKEIDKLAKSKSFKEYADNKTNYYINYTYNLRQSVLNELADTKTDLLNQITALSVSSKAINSAGGGDANIDPKLKGYLDKIDGNLDLALKELKSIPANV